MFSLQKIKDGREEEQADLEQRTNVFGSSPESYHVKSLRNTYTLRLSLYSNITQFPAFERGTSVLLHCVLTAADLEVGSSLQRENAGTEAHAHSMLIQLLNTRSSSPPDPQAPPIGAKGAVGMLPVPS